LALKLDGERFTGVAVLNCAVSGPSHPCYTQVLA
jgi:hypothetical protein